jgi:predicted PurR-regulated permease PerM
LIPFVIGLVIVYLMLPIVNRLNNHMPRWAAILTMYLILLLVLVGLAAYVIPLLVFQARELVGTIPSFSMEEVKGQSEAFLSWYRNNVPSQVRAPLEESFDSAYETLKSNLTTYMTDVGTFLFNQVMQVINTVIFLLGLIVVPVWMFHVINDHKRGYVALNRFLPSWIRPDFWALLRIMDHVLSSYIRGQIILGIAVGSAAGIGLWVLGWFGIDVNYILLLAVIAGFTELIPVLGPIIGAIPAVTIGLFDSPTTAIIVGLLYVGIQMLENAVLVPRIIGESVDIHPAVLILLMVVAGQLFGLLGILLVAPVVAVGRDVFLYLYGRLSGQPVPEGVMPGSFRDARPPGVESVLPSEEATPVAGSGGGQPLSSE